MASKITIRAVRARQGNTDVFTFFLPGSRLLEIADISRIGQNTSGDITGFQRPEIKSHIRAITEYLDQESVIFPNSIILALAPGIKFKAARGTKPEDVAPDSEAGTLHIPIRVGRKAGWIVDGQQRTLALAEASHGNINVPVVAFVSGDLAVHREQFILVNKAKPLSARLIDELLPQVGAILPRDLSTRRVPSALCAALNSSSESPFFDLIRRPSSASAAAVIIDSSLTRMMRKSINDPRGALASYSSPDSTADMDAMFRVMVAFWSAVKDVFPDAWGLPPEKSRLMHSAGIEAMGILMDQIIARSKSQADDYRISKSALENIAPHCKWTEGRWEKIDREWNDIQYTSKDVRLLSNLLISLDRELNRMVAA